MTATHCSASFGTPELERSSPAVAIGTLSRSPKRALNFISVGSSILWPEKLKKAIEGKSCIHDSSRNSAGELRRGFQTTLDVTKTPGAVHPLVRLHPVTKRKALFLGRRPGAYIHGLSVAESEALLDALWAHATQDRFAWYQKWRIGDLVMWDNRCVMHRRDAFDENLRRLMHRTQIVGEPVLAG